MSRGFVSQSFFLILLSVLLGAGRQWAPQGISWNGHWPEQGTPAQEAYAMMAKPGDPGFIGLGEVKQLQASSAATFIDARSKQEFAKGRIPGARNLPFYELEAYQEAALEGLSEDSPIIIYCEGIGCELSFFLGREMQAGGFKNIRIFYGGYPEWKDAGLPIES